MVKVQQELYEVSHVEITARLAELAIFLSQTKSFSVKANSHIKILANLANSLIESDDQLELTDVELQVQKQPASKRDITRQPNTSVETNTEQKLLDKLLSNFQNENEKLWQFVQKGEQNTEFLKTCFDKLLDNMSQRDKDSVNNDIPNRYENVNMNTFPYMQDKNKGGPVSINLPNNRPSSPYGFNHPGNKAHDDPRFDPNRFYSVYEVKDVRQTDYRETINDNETIQGLKDEIAKMTKELKALKREKSNEESGLQEIVKKLIEIKSESEEIIRQKDRKIEQLMADLYDANNKMVILENELLFLKENNSMLEQTVNDVFKAQKKVMDFGDVPYDAPKKETQKLIDELRASNVELKKKLKRLELELHEKDHKQDQDEYFKLQNNNLSNRVKELEKQNTDLENKNNQLCDLIEKKLNTTVSTKTKSVSSEDYDLLKCLYVQGLYIEDFIEFNQNASVFNNEV